MDSFVRASLRFPCALDQLCRVRAFVRTACYGSFWPVQEEDRLWQVQLAVTEAVSNIVIHGCCGCADREIDLTVEAFPDRVCIRLDSPGRAFDPETVEPPAFDGTRQGGFGLYLIQQCVDVVLYSHPKPGLNRVWLVKFRNCC